MLSRHIKTSQVKCNFCLQWITFFVDIRLGVNICDYCLHKGSDDNSLRAVSPTGEIYQISFVKQNNVPDIPQEHTIPQNLFKDIQIGKTFQQTDLIEKSVFSSDLNKQQRNTQVQDIMTKWNILSKFLQDKETLQKEQTKCLKILISQKADDLKNLKRQFKSQLTSPKIQKSLQQNEKEQQNLTKIILDKQNNIPKSVSKNNFRSANKIKQNKEYSKNSVKNSNKDTLKILKFQENSSFKSPLKGGLKQVDFNFLNVSHCKLSDLKQNNFTSGKRLNTSFFGGVSFDSSSRVRTSLFLSQSGTKPHFGASTSISIANHQSNEQMKIIEQIKNRIMRHLQKNYESQSLGRLMLSIVLEAYENTSIQGKTLQLVSYNLSYTDFRCYLQTFDWAGIQVLKLVNTKLSDDQLKTLIDFIFANKIQLKALVLTGNRLTQASIEYLSQQDLNSVKQIYLGKNRILKGKVRTQIVALQNKYSLYL